MLVAVVLVVNASLFAPVPQGGVKLIAHRGVHQGFDLAEVTNDTCTATRIQPPIAPEIENTIASMRSAFSLGADVVELDVHPTTDGHFAVFHDWMLECRTDGSGATRDHDLAYLKALDVGYGYTADGGASFPLRGTGVGLMPALDEVFVTLPSGRFLVNFKSKDAREGQMLADMLAASPEWRKQVVGVYGGDPPTREAQRLLSGLRGYSGATLRDCLLPYFLLGWMGVVPDGCRNTFVPVPSNVAPWLWGWPNRFLQRMNDADSEVILFGPFNPGDAGSSGIDTVEAAQGVPPHFNGYVSTNAIDVVAPLLKPQP